MSLSKWEKLGKISNVGGNGDGNSPILRSANNPKYLDGGGNTVRRYDETVLIEWVWKERWVVVWEMGTLLMLTASTPRLVYIYLTPGHLLHLIEIREPAQNKYIGRGDGYRLSLSSLYR